MRFNVIMADPPWKYADARNHKSMGMAESSYSTMLTLDMVMLPVDKVAADDCMLCLWATMPKLEDALYLIKMWGFKYITCGFVWVKLNPNVPDDAFKFEVNDIYSGLGHWVNGNAELVLFGRKGSPYRANKAIKQIVLKPRGAHSVKPALVRSRIERLFGDCTRLEMFGREQHEGWITIGNEITGNDIRVDLERLAAQ